MRDASFGLAPKAECIFDQISGGFQSIGLLNGCLKIPRSDAICVVCKNRLNGLP
jgi:hypothetical protein